MPNEMISCDEVKKKKRFSSSADTYETKVYLNSENLLGDLTRQPFKLEASKHPFFKFLIR